MKPAYDEHPDENRLMAYALDNRDRNITKHIETCPSCSRYIKEIRTIREVLSNFPDKEVPDKLRKRINQSLKNQNSILHLCFDFSLNNWYKNPLIIGLGISALAIFLYFFLVFML